ncbi:hypothetical protein SKUN_001183 [Spiroplasma kunkelii CR2-3x]|uniref:Uncharacterized protein n=1 Tax=Spiroplasma kunkelii CR2-3x TaxID=273035 RepID=A0A0K2JHJ0_SPIKU|nr:hypothetical protein [Spiroplasma kunkelii]ALA98059.1 hypothetical protein SKUN_001183 [Spiroplasma kunkelii CR2-3x]
MEIIKKLVDEKFDYLITERRKFMCEILNCEAGCHARTQKYKPRFDFRAEFSKKEDGSFYEPHKQNNKRKNISNYRIHKTSIQLYNKCGNEVISYIGIIP